MFGNKLRSYILKYNNPKVQQVELFYYLESIQDNGRTAEIK